MGATIPHGDRLHECSPSCPEAETSRSAWKAGDVAMVECSDGQWRQAVCRYPLPGVHTSEPYWWFPDNGLRLVSLSKARPVVVLDPEDRRQVEKLRDLADRAWVEQVGDTGLEYRRAERGNALLTALRRMVAPPRPVEPRGLGAVVEDDEGRRYLRVCTPAGGADWRALHDRTDAPLRWWREVPAVRVLSEGVR